LKDTVVFFSNSRELLFLDFKLNAWDKGEIQTLGGGFLEVAENASIIKVNCAHSDVFVTGGLSYSTGAVLNWAYGIKFKRDFRNSLVAEMSYSEPMMLLPDQRMMHQTTMVTNAEGK